MDSTDQDLGALAIEVNQAHEHVMNGLNSSVAHAVHAGTLLLQVKTRVRHGAWLGWLRCNCTFSERTGQMYMRMAQKLPNLDPSKAQRVADLALREAVKLLSATNKDESSVPLDSPSPPRSQTSTESSPLVERLPNGHWQVTFKPNTTPETVRLKMQALQAEPRFMKMASKVEKKNAVAQALHDEAEKLQRQAAKAEREADRERRRFKAEFRSEFIQRHGRLFPYTEVCTFFDVDAALDRRLSTLNIGETLKILCARPLCPVIGCPDLTEKDVYELCYCMERQ